uniref:Uncharacterized protein n=1 Tax=Euplotes harpa TaxID=151035 RepID=A0A7S3N8N8_9SPIT|mmetsp:Transcript_23835/g.27427  ORF Transcript_23835/g.27427 Transcript_23835/m.27427 type:complete len:370 (+) Transcript_23835:705-1814(+)
MLQNDVKMLTNIKSSLEVEFSEAVDTRDNEISSLKKQLVRNFEELEKANKANKELEHSLAKFKRRRKSNITLQNQAKTNFEFKKQDVQNETQCLQKVNDRVETQASIEEEFNPKYENQADEESESDSDQMFDNSDNFTVTINNRGTNDNLADLIGNRTSYHGELMEEEFLFEHLNIDKAEQQAKSQRSDKGTQTKERNSFRLEPIEEEKYNTSLQDYSMDLRIEDIVKNNESINTSSILNPAKKKDALEEYFKMTVLAMKVAHHDLDSVCQIKASALLKKAKYMKIPFYEWQTWIERELNDMYLDNVYNSGGRPSLLRVASRDSHSGSFSLKKNKSWVRRKYETLKTVFSKKKKPSKKKKGYRSLSGDD